MSHRISSETSTRYSSSPARCPMPSLPPSDPAESVKRNISGASLSAGVSPCLESLCRIPTHSNELSVPGVEPPPSAPSRCDDAIQLGPHTKWSSPWLWREHPRPHSGYVAEGPAPVEDASIHRPGPRREFVPHECSTRTPQS